MLRAIDHDEYAHRVYVDNHGDHALRRNLASVRPRDLEGAHAWWMSPPCQPYTVRGKGRDVDDPRAASLLYLMALLREGGVAPPERLAMENVPGFPGSRAHALVRTTLRGLGYHVTEQELCPSELGVPMVRRRWFLLADRREEPQRVTRVEGCRPLAPYLHAGVDRSTHPELFATEDLLARYGDNLPTVEARDSDAVTHCFTGAYGRSPVYSGSWLVTEEGLRRFLPEEIAGLMGFPDSFRLVPKRMKAYKLVGNAVSVDVVRALLRPWT